MPADAERQLPSASGGISRRSVVKAAAWTMPVIAFAAPAPAYAASECTPTTSFDDLEVGTSPSSITFYPSGITATLSYSSTPGDTGEVAATNPPNSWNYIELEMLSRITQGNQIQVTITMSQPVEGLSFVLHDIDSEEDGYQDTVIVGTSGYTLVPGTNIQGAGTSGDPIRPIIWGDTPISSGQGDVRITWAAAQSVFTFTYRAGISGNSNNQHIGLGNLSYDACIFGAEGQSQGLRSARGLSTGHKVPISTEAPVFDTSAPGEDL